MLQGRQVKGEGRSTLSQCQVPLPRKCKVNEQTGKGRSSSGPIRKAELLGSPAFAFRVTAPIFRPQAAKP